MPNGSARRTPPHAILYSRAAASCTGRHLADPTYTFCRCSLCSLSHVVRFFKLCSCWPAPSRPGKRLCVISTSRGSRPLSVYLLCCVLLLPLCVCRRGCCGCLCCLLCGVQKCGWPMCGSVFVCFLSLDFACAGVRASTARNRKQNQVDPQHNSESTPIRP